MAFVCVPIGVTGLSGPAPLSPGKYEESVVSDSSYPSALAGLSSLRVFSVFGLYVIAGWLVVLSRRK